MRMQRKVLTENHPGETAVLSLQRDLEGPMYVCTYVILTLRLYCPSADTILH